MAAGYSALFSAHKHTNLNAITRKKAANRGAPISPRHFPVLFPSSNTRKYTSAREVLTGWVRIQSHRILKYGVKTMLIHRVIRENNPAIRGDQSGTRYLSTPFTYSTLRTLKNRKFRHSENSQNQSGFQSDPNRESLMQRRL